MGPVADLSKTLDFSILKDKTVLVTGGASGLGASIATSFAENGATVTIADVNEKAGTEFVEALKARGLQLNYISADVTDWQSQVDAFKSAITSSERKSIDIVVAAAGVGGLAFIGRDEEPPSLDKDPPLPRSASLNFDVNAKGVYYTSKLAQHYFALLPSSQNRAMPEFRKCLVVISSLAGYLELNAADYTASKWAIRGFFRSTRSKMEDLGYRVNLIAPWIMDTPMSKGLADMCRKKRFPVGDAKDVTKAVIRSVTDGTICGRALAVSAAETFDLRDDIGGLNAGIAMKEYLDGEAKGFMSYSGQRV